MTVGATFLRRADTFRHTYAVTITWLLMSGLGMLLAVAVIQGSR